MSWADYHRNLFGLHRSDDDQMVTEWQRLFTNRGYSEEELRGASQVLVTDTPPRSRADHLTRLVAILQENRERLVSPPPEPEDDRGQCVDCRNSGRVQVPHWKSLDRQNLRWYGLTVLCHCPLGNWYAAHGRYPDGRTPMRLDEYAKLVPDWRDLLRERALRDRELARAVHSAELSEPEKFAAASAFAEAEDKLLSLALPKPNQGSYNGDVPES